MSCHGMALRQWWKMNSRIKKDRSSIDSTEGIYRSFLAKKRREERRQTVNPWMTELLVYVYFNAENDDFARISMKWIKFFLGRIKPYDFRYYRFNYNYNYLCIDNLTSVRARRACRENHKTDTSCLNRSKEWIEWINQSTEWKNEWMNEWMNVMWYSDTDFNTVQSFKSPLLHINSYIRYHLTSYHITSWHITPFDIISYHMMSHHID